MAAAPSQVPVRFPSGMTTDQPFGPLANYGLRNPFFYHEVEDDFDASLTTSIWTQTKSGNGTVAHTPGDGGLALFSTNSSVPAATDICSIQLPAASFNFTLGKKSFFLVRLQVSDATNAAFLVGLMQTSTTPFTVTDGLYFLKASGATSLVLDSTASSVTTAQAIPTAANPLASNTNIDLGWYINRRGEVAAFVGAQLVGWIPQSGSGAATPSVPGAVASFKPTLTAANLNLTVAVQSGTASSKTMTVDFVMAAKER